MAVRVGINGFGRIGRLVMRAAIESGRDDIEFVGINDLGDTKSNAHLLKYDTVHGKLDTEISTGDDWMDFGKGKIKVTAERDPAKLPWKELDVDIAMECTGIFTDKESASKHLEAGAKRVLVSAPASADRRWSTVSTTTNWTRAIRSSRMRPARRTASPRWRMSSTRRSVSSEVT